jgi:hypothetical protein
MAVIETPGRLIEVNASYSKQSYSVNKGLSSPQIGRGNIAQVLKEHNNLDFD